MEQEKRDPLQIKNHILSIIKTKGPALPVQVAKEVSLSSLFASAFLSSLASEGEIKISSLRVGNSPLYYVPGQESMLEKFSKYLPGKEQEAFSMLREKKVLKDLEQEPSIRVALRQIKDFSFPLILDKPDKRELYWRFHSFNEEESILKIQGRQIKKEIKPEIREISKTKRELEIKPEIIELKPKLIELKKQVEDNLGIFDKEEIEEKEPPVIKKKEKKLVKKPVKKKTNEKFFEQVKASLNSNNTEILDIINFNKSEIILKVRENNQEILAIAFKKKRVTDKDITRTWKKFKDLGLEFKILSLGSPNKSFLEFLEASKSIGSLDKI